MIFIVVKFPVRPDRVDGWLDVVADFTAATRAEPGNLFFEWSTSLDEPDTFVLVEGFADSAAGAAHVQSEHFQAATRRLGPELSATPQIINGELPATGWGPMAEIQPPS